MTSTVELVILLRPVIVEDGDWQSMVSEPTERMEELAKKGKVNK
jgi:hypothetical protein